MVLSGAASALATPAAAPYTVAPAVSAAYAAIVANQKVKEGLDFLRADHDDTIAEQKTICEIPAPPFKEEVRARDYMQRLAALGLKDVKMDSEGNVFGILPGTGKGPRLLVCAHLDTVFPEGTDVTVKEKDGRLYAPGIADDTRGLVALLSVIRAFNKTGIKTVGDVIFCGDVGEEGLGDLRGVKALFRDDPNIDGFVSVDGTGNGICYLATGSHRYEITCKGPGGHSFGAFGLPSATHALGRAIAKIADLQTPKEPKTTFTVGTVSGGTSVNSIAAEAKMLVDMRSNDLAELLKLEAKFLGIVKSAVSEENARWNSDKMTVNIDLVGDRPAGSQPRDEAIVQAAWAASKAIGVEPELEEPSSTDANVPIALGVPGITIGGGGKSFGGHSPGEYYDPTDAWLGPQQIFLNILGLVGVDGVSEPLLAKGAKRPILLEVGGRLLLVAVSPYRAGATLMVPLRAVVEALKGEVAWDAATRGVVARLGGRTLSAKVGSSAAFVDGARLDLPAAVELVKDTTVVPLEALTALGLKAKFVEAAQALMVSSGQ
ncbi:MAG: M20/M25/M40 family metallo-hydrolase [Firmicutes bacterium]|nr:M20/M25/M40 family metallo-hydrolase [Bacillota bacterium]